MKLKLLVIALCSFLISGFSLAGLLKDRLSELGKINKIKLKCDPIKNSNCQIYNPYQNQGTYSLSSGASSCPKKMVVRTVEITYTDDMMAGMRGEELLLTFEGTSNRNIVMPLPGGMNMSSKSSFKVEKKASEDELKISYSDKKSSLFKTTKYNATERVSFTSEAATYSYKETKNKDVVSTLECQYILGDVSPTNDSNVGNEADNYVGTQTTTYIYDEDIFNEMMEYDSHMKWLKSEYGKEYFRSKLNSEAEAEYQELLNKVRQGDDYSEEVQQLKETFYDYLLKDMETSFKFFSEKLTQMRNVLKNCDEKFKKNKNVTYCSGNKAEAVANVIKTIMDDDESLVFQGKYLQRQTLSNIILISENTRSSGWTHAKGIADIRGGNAESGAYLNAGSFMCYFSSGFKKVKKCYVGNKNIQYYDQLENIVD